MSAKHPVAKAYKPLSNVTTELAPFAVKEAKQRLRRINHTINKLTVEAHAILKMLEHT